MNQVRNHTTNRKPQGRPQGKPPGRPQGKPQGKPRFYQKPISRREMRLRRKTRTTYQFVTLLRKLLKGDTFDRLHRLAMDNMAAPAPISGPRFRHIVRDARSSQYEEAFMQIVFAAVQQGKIMTSDQYNKVLDAARDAAKKARIEQRARQDAAQNKRDKTRV